MSKVSAAPHALARISVPIRAASTAVPPATIDHNAHHAASADPQDVLTRAVPVPTAVPSMSAANGTTLNAPNGRPTPDVTLAPLQTMQARLYHLQATAAVLARSPVPTATPPALPQALAQPKTAVRVSDMSQMMSDMQDTYRLMQATMLTMQVLRKGQPSDDDVAAVQTQMRVVGRRLARLQQELQAVRLATSAPTLSPPTTGPVQSGQPSLAQIRNVVVLLQQISQVTRNLLADPAIDDATLTQLQVILGQLQDLVTQTQGILGQMRQPSFAHPTPTPTPTPLPTPTSPVVFGSSMANDEQARLGQLEEMLKQLQTLLQQMQNQSGGAATPSSNQGAMPGMTPQAGSTGTSGQSQDMMSLMSSMMSMMDSMMGGMGNSGSTGGAGAAPGIPGGANNPLTRQGQAGGLTVTVTPLNLRTPGLASLDFYVKLETHSVDLSQDLTQVAALRLPSGVELLAAGWVGPRGGHHVEGTLSFPALDGAATPVLPANGTLTLVLRNFAGLGERTFAWDLSQVR